MTITDTLHTYSSARMRDLANRLQIMWLITEREENNVAADYRVANLIAYAVQDGDLTEDEGEELRYVFYVHYCAI